MWETEICYDVLRSAETFKKKGKRVDKEREETETDARTRSQLLSPPPPPPKPFLCENQIIIYPLLKLKRFTNDSKFLN